MKSIEGDFFTIENTDSTYAFTGDMLLDEYSAVTRFLESTLQEVPDDRILFDIENLTYLNSPGISVISRAISGLPEGWTVVFKINNESSWQEISVTGIAMACPGKVEIAE